MKKGLSVGVVVVSLILLWLALRNSSSNGPIPLSEISKPVTAAIALWHAGRQQDALGLLERGPEGMADLESQAAVRILEMSESDYMQLATRKQISLDTTGVSLAVRELARELARLSTEARNVGDDIRADSLMETVRAIATDSADPGHLSLLRQNGEILNHIADDLSTPRDRVPD